MTLTLIKSAIAPFMRGMSADAWLENERMTAEKVKLFRDYVDGDHRANLTPEMRRMLRISNNGSLNEFNDNYCPIIIDTMVDRLKLERIEADNDAATAWAAEIFKQNRLDALQTEVHAATVRDGRSFVLVDMLELPDGSRRVRFSHEPAFDGTYGVIPFYATDADRTPLFALKIWRMSRKEVGDTVRVNVYHDDRIERYISEGEHASSLVPYEDDGVPAVIPWTLPNGEPLGVPIITFLNRDGISEIESVVPLQDALNRTLYSMVMTAELTAFAIRVLIGNKAPEALTPGMILSYYAQDADGNPTAPNNEFVMNWLQSIRLEQWEQGDIVPYIEQARYLKDEIFEITNTPTAAAADNSSGESLKQREVKLLGKVQRFQVRNGNSWEDAFALAHRVQQAYGASMPPAFNELVAKWKDAQVRNKKEIVELANAVKDQVDLRTYLEIIAEVFDWSAEKIDKIMAEKERERQQEIRESVRGAFGEAFSRRLAA